MKRGKGASATTNPGQRAETKARLLDAAIREFAQHGYSGARVENIADAASANKQAIYYYFADKDDLFTAALERCYELVHMNDDKLTFPELPALEALGELVDSLFRNLNGMRDIISVIADENRNKGKHLTNTRIRTINRPTIDAIATVLERGKNERTIRPEIDAEQLWLSILALIMFYFTNSFTLSHLLNRDLMSPRHLEERRKQIKELVLLAVRL
jgi:AcrR family transcriptional regulator